MSMIPLNKNTAIPYSVQVDGFEIARITLPPMTQSGRDQIRQMIANTYGVPRHYIRMVRDITERNYV